MLNRREIIQTSMAFSSWPALRAFRSRQRIPGSGTPDDENFWAYVRSEFELAPEFTNLVSVVRGISTKANREITFNEAARLNRSAAPLPDLNWREEIRKKAADLIGAPVKNVALLRNTTEGVTTVRAVLKTPRRNRLLFRSGNASPADHRLR